ncbi:MAG: hypothetical protein KDB63_00690 [Nocardioidaceae bacterium]|nr:hypothetical protein [Nocardioidaceae bacterium]
MSRSTLRTLLVGAVAGFLIGGVTAVVTPAGAALATDWAKIFKQEIKPRADRRYVTKANAAKAYAPRLRVIRGTFVVAADTAAKDELLMTPISFGYALDPAPKVSVVHVGGTLPVGCSGDWASPNAARGYLCIFEGRADNATAQGALQPDGSSPGAGSTGALIRVKVTEDGPLMVVGSWAVRPATISGE